MSAYEKQITILTKALKLVPFDGWSDEVLQKAAMDSGFPADYAKIAFKNGSIDAIKLFLNQIDEKVQERIDRKKMDAMKVREKIFYILSLRFEVMEKQKAVIRKTTQFLAMPAHLCEATKMLWEVASNIWYLIGDKSVDFNYYTKRATLAAVYSSSLLYWLNDNESGGLQPTLDFMRRRINNAVEFGAVKGKIMNIFKGKLRTA